MIRRSDLMVCPVPACPQWTRDFSVLLRHLSIKHPQDHFQFVDCQKLVQCPRCGMFLTEITPRHFNSLFCTRQTARRHRIHLHSRAIAAESTPFLVGGKPVEYVSHFRYLGRVLSRDDTDDMAAFARLEKTKKVWARFSVLLHANAASALTMGRFYRMILQQILLFGSATWVLSTPALQRLERFHARCARGMAHRHIRCRPDGSWIYPPTAEVLSACGLKPISVYAQR